MSIQTYADLVEHGLDYLGGEPDAPALRDARRAALSAYREVANARTWSYLYQQGRLTTSAPYATGTVAYHHAGGIYARMLILSGGTWPDWAADGDVRIGVVSHKADERKSDTVLTLDPALNPGADIDFDPHAITDATNATPIVVTSVAHGLVTGDTAIVEGVLGNLAANGTWTVTRLTADTFSLQTSVGVDDYDSGGTWRHVPTTTFTLYRDAYLLPPDFIAQDTPVYQENFGGLTWIHPTDVMWGHRYLRSAGTPFYFTIQGDTRHPFRLSARLFPYPDQVRTIDYVYHRRPRPLGISEYREGTVTLTSGSTTATGSGAAFTAAMAGAVLRCGTALIPPSSPIGAAPAVFETIVLEVLTAATLRLADAAPADFTAVKYAISDPVDVEPGAMGDAVLRGVEKYLHVARNIDDKRDAFARFDLALRAAKAADSRSFQGRAVGAQRSRSMPVKYMPARFD